MRTLQEQLDDLIKCKGVKVPVVQMNQDNISLKLCIKYRGAQ